MTANEFNKELQTLINKALAEGVGTGKISAGEMVGLIEIQKSNTIVAIMASIAVQQRSRIHLPPPNGFYPKGAPKGSG